MNKGKNKIYFQIQCMIEVTFKISGLEVYHSIDDVALMGGGVEGAELDFLLHTPHRNKLQMA